MNQKFEYDEIIHEIPENGGAYVIFPWDIRKIFGRGRLKVHATPDGEICYMIGVLKSIRKQLGKGDGDSIHVVIEERI